VQLSQLLWGASNPSLQSTATWEALAVLECQGFLSPQAAQTLQQSYDFLRRVESALRIVDDRSINTIPDDSGSQRRLARRLGYQDSASLRAEQAMLADLRACTARVRSLYDEHLQKLRDFLTNQTLPHPSAAAAADEGAPGSRQ
jgi:glutamate-ammonia-ligase adenylyltransferase